MTGVTSRRLGRVVRLTGRSVVSCDEYDHFSLKKGKGGLRITAVAARSVWRLIVGLDSLT